MDEGEHAQPVSTVYLLNTMGQVIGWPICSISHGERRPSEWHVARFYRREDRAAGRPERDLRMACETGLEMHGWRIREDGSPFWARILLKPLEDEERRVLGFVLVQTELGGRASELPPGPDDFHSPPVKYPEATATSLRGQVRALASILDNHAEQMPESVRAMLSPVAKELERLSASIETRAEFTHRTTTLPSKFDRRRK